MNPSQTILIEKSVSEFSHCANCRGKIALNALRVTYVSASIHKKLYHLRCFRPALQSPLRSGVNVCCTGVTEEGDLGKVEKYLRKWNEPFIFDESKVPKLYTFKRVETTAPALYRLWLEVFRYLSVQEIEQSAALTCKDWFHVSREEELWKAKCLNICSLPDQDSQTSFRQRMIAAYLGCCYNCKSFLSLENISQLCPYRKKPLCVDCSRMYICSRVAVATFCREFFIDQSLPDYLDFPCFKVAGKKCANFIDLREKMISYAEHRREALLESIETEYSFQLPQREVEKIRKYPIVQLYICRYVPANACVTALLKFFGRDETKEDLRKSVREFVKEWSTLSLAQAWKDNY